MPKLSSEMLFFKLHYMYEKLNQLWIPAPTGYKAGE